MLRQGLPQRDEYDLKLPSRLDVDETGARLAIGTTTGSLWYQDQGDGVDTRSARICRQSTRCALFEMTG